jgi:hypothetical protein
MRWHESILEYKRGRYLKFAVLLSAAAIAAYAWHEPRGGTWLGYTLGTVGAARRPTRDAVSALRKIGAKFRGEQAVQNERLLTEMTRRSVLIDQARRDTRFRALLRAWLVFHLPLSFGLLGALIAHTVSVFFLWEPARDPRPLREPRRCEGRVAVAAPARPIQTS